MRKALKTIVLLLILSVLVCLATVLGQGWFRFQREIENMPLSTAVAQYTDKDDYVVFEDIDDDFVKAVISVEDKRFFDRQGYDFVALIRAFYNNFRAGRVVEVGSTITEQIAKNLYLGGYVNGIEEKTAEIFIMLDLEKDTENYHEQKKEKECGADCLRCHAVYLKNPCFRILLCFLYRNAPVLSQ